MHLSAVELDHGDAEDLENGDAEELEAEDGVDHGSESGRIPDDGDDRGVFPPVPGVGLATDELCAGSSGAGSRYESR